MDPRFPGSTVTQGLTIDDIVKDQKKPKKPKKGRGPIRDNVESFGVAILMAVLLKYVCIEAYQIPTPSMQPTMMGSPTAGVNDRLLVDKIRYQVCEPQRFDITVFRYPIRQTQNYVKRCVGMPGDRLHIGGGNLYLVDEGVAEKNVLGSLDKMHALRKPDVLQERLWREVYPARRLVYGDQKILKSWFDGGGWREDGTDLVADIRTGQPAQLYYASEGNGAITNLIWDGYPTTVAQAIRAEQGDKIECVQDARFSFDLSCTEAPSELRIDISVAAKGAGEKERRFVLEMKDGKARILARLDGKEAAATQPFDLKIAAGRTRVAFAHLDDFCIAWLAGTKVQELDCGALKIARTLPSASARTGIGLELRGGGSVRLADLKVDYDQHWTTGSHTDSNLIVVPAGHYFMMGDNTLASADSREWTTIKVGMTPDGRLVDPKSDPSARVIEGNKRSRATSGPVDADENPVALPAIDMVAFMDQFGEVYALKAKIGASWGNDVVQFGEPGKEWMPEQHKTPFVPRAHILGRALVNFWPTVPFGPQRIGLIR